MHDAGKKKIVTLYLMPAKPIGDAGCTTLHSISLVCGAGVGYPRLDIAGG